MVDVEVDATLELYGGAAPHLGHEVLELDRSLCHIIASGMFDGIFEVVIHDMPRDTRRCAMWSSCDAFYTGGMDEAGWSHDAP